MDKAERDRLRDYLGYCQDVTVGCLSHDKLIEILNCCDALEAENRALKDTEFELRADLKIAVEALEEIEGTRWMDMMQAREMADAALAKIRGGNDGNPS